MIIVVAAVLVAAGAGGAFLATRVGAPKKALPLILGQESEGAQVVALVSMTLHDASDDTADSLTVFGIDRTGRHPVTVFVPTGTLVQIPALTYGPAGDALTRSDFAQKLTVENLLGAQVDRSFVLDDVTIGEIIDALGGINVDVTEDIYIKNDQGGQELEFDRGPQHMNAATAVLYMTELGGRSEILRFERQQKVWEGIFSLGADRVRQAIREVDPGSLGPEDKDSLGEILGAMAARPIMERLYEPLQVEPVLTGGDDETYQVDEARLDLLAERAFPLSLLGDGPPSARARVEIRNAEGTPGAGEQVAAVLIEGGMQVVLGSNARRFGLAKTKILIYDELTAALGERIRELLGIGRVEISPLGQTVVDATIVIGRDLVKR